MTVTIEELTAKVRPCERKKMQFISIGKLDDISGSMKISRRNPCSSFFSVNYSINRHKIL